MHDILSIKSELSEFANLVLDQEWRRHGCPENIKIVDVDLCIQYSHIKRLIFGDIRSASNDGVQLSGPGASRHLTYRTKQALVQAIPQLHQSVKSHSKSKLMKPVYTKPYISYSKRTETGPLHKRYEGRNIYENLN